MNVYDFDDTIFVPDSSYCFLRYCARHYPRAVCHAVPAAFFQYLVYLKNGRKDAKKLKEAMFSFLNRVDHIEQIVLDFWDENFHRLEGWYLKQKREDDLIISASPEFLLRPVATRLGVHLIATPMDPHTGKILGNNCHDEEKKRRFLEAGFSGEIDHFYSDSMSDAPMAALAKRAWLVKEHQCMPWPDK